MFEYIQRNRGIVITKLDHCRLLYVTFFNRTKRKENITQPTVFLNTKSKNNNAIQNFFNNVKTSKTTKSNQNVDDDNIDDNNDEKTKEMNNGFVTEEFFKSDFMQSVESLKSYCGVRSKADFEIFMRDFFIIVKKWKICKRSLEEFLAISTPQDVSFFCAKPNYIGIVKEDAQFVKKFY